jgi:hypothetical protein
MVNVLISPNRITRVERCKTEGCEAQVKIMFEDGSTVTVFDDKNIIKC